MNATSILTLTTFLAVLVLAIAAIMLEMRVWWPAAEATQIAAFALSAARPDRHRRGDAEHSPGGLTRDRRSTSTDPWGPDASADAPYCVSQARLSLSSGPVAGPELGHSGSVTVRPTVAGSLPRVDPYRPWRDGVFVREGASCKTRRLGSVEFGRLDTHRKWG